MYLLIGETVIVVAAAEIPTFKYPESPAENVVGIVSSSAANEDTNRTAAAPTAPANRVIVAVLVCPFCLRTEEPIAEATTMSADKSFFILGECN
jgi:hypothetical protein